MTLSITDEGYYRNLLCALNLMLSFLVILFLLLLLLLLLLPGKEPDSLNECIWFRLKNSAQCRAAQQVFYKLFILKIIPKLQLKLCTLYVVHFLPVLDFRAALNPSIVSADVVLVGS